MMRRVLLSFFAVLALCACFATLSPAQEQANPQPEPNRGSGVNPSFGQRLAKESREAAGEDDNAKLKHSSSVRWVSKLTGLDLESAYWLCVVLNFAVIAGAIFWFSRKSLPGIFRNRTASIQKAMEQARKASEEANRRLSDIESRLSRLSGEIGEMRTTAEREAAAEEERIKAAAVEDARKIVASAEQEIAAAAKSARRELTAYAADLAVALARKQIQVDPATDQALVRGFAQQIAASDSQSKGRN
jgi:F-type H+-transporting ATPase subunit b